MGEQTNYYFHNDNKSRDELIENCYICQTSYSDVNEIVNILLKSFDIPSKEEVVRQLLYSNADLDNSVKIIDRRDNKIYGLLIFSNFNINLGSPISNINPMLSEYLNKYKHINGHSFIIDSRLRGSGFDKKMLLNKKDFLEKYDFIWCGVENKLKTHLYWERLGFVNIFSNHEAKFYIYTDNKKMILDIFILKMLYESCQKK